MNRRTRTCLTFLASGIIATLFLAAAPVADSRGISVGEFVTLVAAQLRLPSGDQTSITTEGAKQVLAKSGVEVKSDLAAPLTSGDAQDIFQQLGITLKVEHPEKPLGKDQAMTLVTTFGDDFRVRMAGKTILTPFPSSVASGASVPSLEDLASCQDLPKPKDCNECCRALGTYTNKICGKACNNSPKASAYEPIP